MPRVSVIIPAYNAAAAISSTLASVAGQTAPAAEVIVVDDGSTDGTSDAVRRWEGVLPLRLITLEENIGRGLGAGGARALGIAESTGDVIALLDADDLWLPEHLAVMLDEHHRHGGLITANYLLWVPGQEVGRTPASELVPVPPPDQQPLAVLSENFVFISALFSRQLYDAAGPFRNIRCEDWDLWIRMVRTGARVHMPGTVTALYRQGPASVSGTDKLLTGDIDLLDELRPTASGDELAVIEAALRRRRAKQRFLEGVALADQGRILAARRRFLGALVGDLALGANNSRLNGRVAPRAAACLVAPRTMTRMRQRRQADAGFVVGRDAGRPVPRLRH